MTKTHRKHPRRGRVSRSFFNRDVRDVARDLLGMVLARRLKHGRTIRGRISETEAYGGRGDRASHAYRGKTPRNAVMFGKPGHAYVYFTYGMHWLLNIVCQDEGIPAAVLIRSVELLADAARVQAGTRASVQARDERSRTFPRSHARTLMLSGPARLTKRFHVTGTVNGEDLVTSHRLWIESISPPEAPVPGRIIRTPRIGVGYAGPAARWRRRFLLGTSPSRVLRKNA